MSELLYVHDYGQWHIAAKLPNGAPEDEALCGATFQKAKPHWASQRHWDGLALVVDDREVHSECIVEFWLMPEPVGGQPNDR